MPLPFSPIFSLLHEFYAGYWAYAHRLRRDNQRGREQQTLLKSINNHREYIPVWEQLATDQFDPWQVVPRQVYTHYSRLLISAAFVANCVGCVGVTGVMARANNENRSNCASAWTIQRVGGFQLLDFS